MNKIYGLPKLILVLLGLVISTFSGYAQVGFDNPDPHPSSLIDMKSKEKGLLIPRMTTVDRNIMANPAKKTAHALLVFDITQNMFYVFDTIPEPDRWAALNPFSITGASTDIIASTTGTVKATKFEGYGTTPIGGIIMWSGDPNALPDGWALCDGTTSFGIVTPDLRERFVVGASKSTGPNDNTTVDGNPYLVKQTGGTSTKALTINELPSHDHGGRSGSPRTAGTNNGVDFDHTHEYTDTYPGTTEAVADRNVDDVWDASNTSANRQSTKANANTAGQGPNVWNNHEHLINPQGGSQPFDIRPPYFALAFIIRVK